MCIYQPRYIEHVYFDHRASKPNISWLSDSYELNKSINQSINKYCGFEMLKANTLDTDQELVQLSDTLGA